MTGTEIKTFTTSLLRGYEMDDTTFYVLANIAKNHLESKRFWRKLMTEDSSKTASPSDTYLTMKDLPTDFISASPRKSMVLMSSDGDEIPYTEIAFEDRHKYKNQSGFFYIDHVNNQFGLTGRVSKTYTIYLYYKKKSTDIAAGTTWVFPDYAHPLIGYFVSALQKGGIDYDDIFARMAPENRAVAELIMSNLEAWDADLQLSALGTV